MATRRWTSRSVVLTATFAALAAGGTAACDSVDSAVDEPVTVDQPFIEPTWAQTPSPTAARTASVAPRRSTAPPTPTFEPVEEESGEVFYCADEHGVIVEEELCAGDIAGAGAVYLLWHSTHYARGLPPGTVLSDGETIESDDTETRAAYGLPPYGRVQNGTIKTNVVGRGSVTGGLGDGTAGG